ncbi:hypothetical protein [Glycomyces tenuis]|uniref:hypothetical protein n=1 Tax=Glycomyces tenuis TaxID=58116 RepID=UPI0012DCB2FE|nr:hypothetical protein [Glycomyces tenuis]
MQDVLSGQMTLFLKGVMALEPQLFDNERACLRVSAGYGGTQLSVHGAPAELRQFAEALHRLADEAERNGKRQRALDNAPRRRTKFVAEPVANGKEMKIAA